MSEQKEYLFYKNLKFIWSKKWILLIIPIVIALIVSAISLLGDREYVGKAFFYTSSLDRDELTDDDLLNNKYITGTEDVEINFSVVSRGKVQIKIVGNNKEDVQSKLTSLGTQYLEDLQEEHKFLYDATDKSLKSYQQNLEIIEPLNEKIIEATEALEGQETSDKYIELLNSAVTNQQLLLEYENGVYRKDVDLKMFEKPELLSEEITKSDNYLVQNMVISFALSFFLTLLGIMLWRYIREARRALND
ncbi:hypothetical protein [Bacillus sp. AFS040349]|uniref:hypothetical protein n=1 Tax=Bacillus sp. AFS040349 TaxID=2033502 RepID=UPI000BFCC6CC|nr:hypothetical protein [Bacillus sp. AFS040349]PGT81082.1 hypothetical protein COD11_18685 [Bacillus sp. AFS040349]